MDQEIVFLDSIGACDVEELPSKVPADTARYTCYLRFLT